MIDLVLLAGRLLLLALLYLFLFAAVRAGIGHVTQQRAKKPGGFTVTVTQGPSELMGTTLPVTGPLVIGRSPGADIVIGDDFVSGRHARISPVGAAVVLEDRGSTNGTFLNGTQIHAAQALRQGDSVEVGSVRLRVERT